MDQTPLLQTIRTPKIQKRSLKHLFQRRGVNSRLSKLISEIIVQKRQPLTSRRKRNGSKDLQKSLHQGKGKEAGQGHAAGARQRQVREIEVVAAIPEEVVPEMEQETVLLTKEDPYRGKGSHHAGRDPNLVNDQKRKARRREDHLQGVHLHPVGLSLGQGRRENQGPNLKSQSREGANREIVKLKRTKRRRNLKRSHAQDHGGEIQDQEAQVIIQGGKGLRPETGGDLGPEAKDPSTARGDLGLPTKEVDPETKDPVLGQRRTDQEKGGNPKRRQDPARGLERAGQNQETGKSPKRRRDLVQSLLKTRRNQKDPTVRTKLAVKLILSSD